MSLRETIRGARQEASQASVFDGRGKSESKSEQASTTVESSASTAKAQGFSRRSSARAKPSRELAGSVRSSSSSAGEKTKEERKQDRQSRREQDDLKFDAREALLKSNDEYNKAHRTWLLLMGVGGAILLVCFIASRTITSGSSNINVILGVMSFFVIVSYLMIIASIVYDYRKIRPIRKSVEAQVEGMTAKRMRRVVAEARRKEAAEKAAKGK